MNTDAHFDKIYDELQNEREEFRASIEAFIEENEEEIASDFEHYMYEEGEISAYSVWFTCHLQRAVWSVIKQDDNAKALFKKAGHMYNDFCEMQFKKNQQ